MVDSHSKKNLDHQAAEEKQLSSIKTLEKQWGTFGESLQKHQDSLLKSTHDLRNRVTAILGFCSLLQNDELNSLSAKQKDYIESIISNTHQLLSLIAEISASKIQKSQCMTIENSLKELNKYKKT